MGTHSKLKHNIIFISKTSMNHKVPSWGKSVRCAADTGGSLEARSQCVPERLLSPRPSSQVTFPGTAQPASLNRDARIANCLPLSHPWAGFLLVGCRIQIISFPVLVSLNPISQGH